MRVLHVLPLITMRAGGPVAFVIEAVEATEPLGISATLVSTSLGQTPTAGVWRDVTPAELPPNAEALDLHLFPVSRPRRLGFSPSMGRHLLRSVADFDVVHVHSLWLFPQFAAQLAARRTRVPYIVSPHGALDPYLRRRGKVRKALTDLVWQRAMLERAALLHVTTDEEARLIADVAPAVPRAVVPVGVWTDRFRAQGDGERFRARFLEDHAGPIVLFLGRLTFKKGVDLLIRSFVRPHQGVPDVHLVIAGPDDENLSPRLEAIARECGVDNATTFTGPLFGRDRADALDAATVWALSSYTENFGVAVVEALAAGVPTIVSTAVNLADAIRDGRAGVVADLDAEAFGSALRDLLLDATERAQLSARAQAFAQQFDWRAIAPRLSSMYRDLL